MDANAFCHAFGVIAQTLAGGSGSLMAVAPYRSQRAA